VIATLCLIVFWVGRIIMGSRDSDPVWLCFADLVLIGTHVWATTPLRRRMGKDFGRAPSWTALLLLPLGLAILLALFDLAHALS
jgi:hypothetical protein